MHSAAAPALKKIQSKSPFTESASTQLKSLEPVFATLQSMHERFICCSGDDDTNRDCIYWYQERSHIGLLSAAVWCRGGIALEEYGDIDENGNRRRDLWMRISGISFNCEGKYYWFDFSNQGAKESVRKISGKLMKARAQMRERDAGKHLAENRLALCFVVPAFRDSHPDEAIIQQWIETVRDGCRLQAAVWIGSRVMQGNKGGLYYPGVLLAVQEVKGIRTTNKSEI